MNKRVSQTQLAVASSLVLLLIPLVARTAPPFALHSKMNSHKQTFQYGQLKGFSPDDLSVDAYGCSPEATSVAVYIHGGGWVIGDKSHVHSMPAFFEKHRVCFLSLNYPVTGKPTPGIIDAQLSALHQFDSWLTSSDLSRSLSKPFRNITLIAHSSGAHLTALADKRTPWTSAVRNMVLMDTSAFDLTLRYRLAQPAVKAHMDSIFSLKNLSSAKKRLILSTYSPSLIDSSSSYPKRNLVLITSLNPLSQASARLLQSSYRNIQQVPTPKIIPMDIAHDDFPMMIGTRPELSERLLKLIQSGQPQ